MKKKTWTRLAVSALAVLPLLCGIGVYGDEGTEAAAPQTLQDFLGYALANGNKTEVGDQSWIKGFNFQYMYRGEFHTDFTTDHKPGKKLEAPTQNFIRFTLLDSTPAMNFPEDFGQDEGKDVIFIELYNSEAREYIGTDSYRVDLEELIYFSPKKRVYSHCFDVGGDGFNDLYDSIGDEHNILELKRPITYAQAGNMKLVGRKKKAVYQAVCDVLTDELYKAIGEGRAVEQ